MTPAIEYLNALIKMREYNIGDVVSIETRIGRVCDYIEQEDLGMKKPAGVCCENTTPQRG